MLKLLGIYNIDKMKGGMDITEEDRKILSEKTDVRKIKTINNINDGDTEFNIIKTKSECDVIIDYNTLEEIQGEIKKKVLKKRGEKENNIIEAAKIAKQNKEKLKAPIPGRYKNKRRDLYDKFIGNINKLTVGSALQKDKFITNIENLTNEWDKQYKTSCIKKFNELEEEKKYNDYSKKCVEEMDKYTKNALKYEDELAIKRNIQEYKSKFTKDITDFNNTMKELALEESKQNSDIDKEQDSIYNKVVNEQNKLFADFLKYGKLDISYNCIVKYKGSFIKRTRDKIVEGKVKAFEITVSGKSAKAKLIIESDGEKDPLSIDIDRVCIKDNDPGNQKQDKPNKSDKPLANQIFVEELQTEQKPSNETEIEIKSSDQPIVESEIKLEQVSEGPTIIQTGGLALSLVADILKQ